LALDTTIEDPCLVKPLEVAALLDAAAADKAVAEALIAKGEPTIRQLEARGKAEGKIEGRVEGRVEATTEAIVKILEARGLTVNAIDRETILACHDLERLDRWLRRVAEVSSAEELTNER
jgi:predicted transposase YdaD